VTLGEGLSVGDGVTVGEGVTVAVGLGVTAGVAVALGLGLADPPDVKVAPTGKGALETVLIIVIISVAASIATVV
jgi:hypothetical protein